MPGRRADRRNASSYSALGLLFALLTQVASNADIPLQVDRNLAGLVAPGTRVSVMGVSSIFSSSFKKNMSAVAIRTPYLKVVGMRVESEVSFSRCVVHDPAIL